MNYIIQHPTEMLNEVQAWSTQYIPFEPKGWHLDCRNELRQAISQIAPDGDCLYAAYISQNVKFCDVENVLIYNIGTAAFNTLCKKGICFERGFGSIPPVPATNINAKHYYRYAQYDQFLLWNEDEALVVWHDTTLPTPPSMSKPHLYWHAMRKGTIVCKDSKLISKQFGLAIQLTIPKTARCNLATILKPLLDGVISAFHWHNALRDDIMLERLCKLTDADTADLEQMLYDKTHAVLGARSLVSAYREGIKWNPEDDACMACHVTVRREESCGSWSMSGRLFAVTPKA